MGKVSNPPPHIYSNVGLDRAATRRLDQDWLRQRSQDRATMIVPMHGLKVLSVSDSERQIDAIQRLSETRFQLNEEAVFLGLLGDKPIFAMDVEPEGDELDQFVELRQIAPIISASEAGVLAFARAMMHWRLRHRYCGACGEATVATQGGHARHCAACGLDVFPRTDPAVIVLVTAGDHCVLARSPHFPEGMYSTLAGFVEPGESLEQTLVREIEEEVGLRVDKPVYRSSQPWPFPQSLMLGFRASARFQDLKIDEDEIEQANWFHRDDLRDPERCPIKLPSGDSIARYLVDEWLHEN